MRRPLEKSGHAAPVSPRLIPIKSIPYQPEADFGQQGGTSLPGNYGTSKKRVARGWSEGTSRLGYLTMMLLMLPIGTVYLLAIPWLMKYGNVAQGVFLLVILLVIMQYALVFWAYLGWSHMRDYKIKREYTTSFAVGPKVAADCIATRLEEHGYGPQRSWSIMPPGQVRTEEIKFWPEERIKVSILLRPYGRRKGQTEAFLGTSRNFLGSRYFQSLATKAVRAYIDSIEDDGNDDIGA
jgi:hypothetical protein